MRLCVVTILAVCCCAVVLGQRSRSRSSSGDASQRSRSRSSGDRSRSTNRTRTRGTTTQSQLECSLNNPGALSTCVRQLLLDKRGDVAAKADPLDIPDSIFKTKDWLTLSEIKLRGLSCYSIEDLKLSFPEDTSIAVDAKLSWPNLRGDLFFRARKCIKLGIFRFSACGSISARPTITVEKTTGRLRTTLKINISSEGKLTVIPSNTEVNVDLYELKVKANIQSKVGKFLNKIVGDPASFVVTEVARNNWNKKRAGLQTKAAEQLDKIVVKELAIHLEKILQLGKSSSAKRDAVAETQSKVQVRTGRCRGERGGGERRRTGSRRSRVTGPRTLRARA